MNKKRKIIFSVIMLFFMIYLIIDLNYYKNLSVKENINFKSEKIDFLSMMLETEAKSGKYKEVTSEAWPSDDYVFNENLSGCENGGDLKWDDVTKKVIMEGNSSDKCYVYFDVYVPKRYDAECDNSLISCKIAKLFTGVQGENNMYYHDSTLENGAGDNSYRYAGPSDTTNNFVCFGYDSTDGTCATDYLYRIIGVFDGRVKLIKYDYALTTNLGSDGDYYKNYSDAMSGKNTLGNNSTKDIGIYFWNYSTGSSSTALWSESRLNKINLNTNFYKTFNVNWRKKIEINEWIVGGNKTNKVVNEIASNIYNNEILTPFSSDTYADVIGLMYLSDYAYAAAPSAWTTPLYDSRGNDYRLSSVTSVNWIYMGLYEFTITPERNYSATGFVIVSFGEVFNCGSNGPEHCMYAMRPVFYLNPNVTYVSGNGTKDLPYFIN